ncbi:MAG: M24 family metallopeptidase, partial [Actinomycetota bacterium]|nr:M24 family metallopeptidase [Actinomycetota bacterium]
DTIAVGDREADIARRLEAAFAEWGADDRAFVTIVASGENSALPHHRAGDHQLATGDLLVIDCGAKVDGYHADMTRTFVVGAEPSEWQHEIHSLVLQAQQAARDAVAPEVVAGDIDAAAREPITHAGFGEAFAHGTGHGVGLEIHEQPMLSARSSAVLPENAVVTVEPGIYLPGRGGVRIEDTVVVAHAPQVLTEMQRGLTRVG